MNISIKDVLKRIGPFFILYLLLLCACFIIKLLYTKDEIYFAVNNRYSPLADFFAPYLTDLGNGWTVVILSAILLLFNYRAAFLLASSYAIASILAQIVKFIFDAPRPKLYFKTQFNHVHLVKDVYMLSTHSFPSGHTQTAFSAGIIITYLVKNKNWGVLLVILAALIGFSRMYLSEHFFEDVIAGSVLGVFVTVFWLTYIENKKFIHSPQWAKGLLKRS
jgi:membrane-associated phospholipid phosphatase